ncbi:MAG: ABC transporter ATP-binding protein [Nitrososphaerota archaeon]|nr:ABC transporter ATP-binding protein [Nitrososphaerota archaeon]MDG7014150.1 ABC transporter ATP-binding protein [Nitrososphaerota archaeon]MDG7025493.1 ABC transporter ATP-binding protein [Nitrososphaerota archaeon]
MKALEATRLSKTYRKAKQPALSDLDLAVESGQVFTLLGRNGAGKTTVLRIASTQLLPSSGRAEVLGLDAVKQAKELRERIAIAPQEAETVYPLTPRDHILLSLRMRGNEKRDAVERTQQALEDLELLDVADVNSDWLSGGLKQRVIVAMVVRTDADLVFLDEPTIGLDPLSRRRIWEQLTRLKGSGKTIVLTTHYMDEAEALSDSLVIMDKGRLMASGTPQTVKAMVTDRAIRVDVFDRFSQSELAKYGHVVPIAGRYRVLADAEGARGLGDEAVARRAKIAIGPVSLDDVFVDIVGVREGDEGGG